MLHSACALNLLPVAGSKAVAAAEEGKETTTLAQLNGTWRLVYSSAFQQGGLGNSGAPPFLVPFQLGQVCPALSLLQHGLSVASLLYGNEHEAVCQSLQSGDSNVCQDASRVINNGPIPCNASAG